MPPSSRSTASSASSSSRSCSRTRRSEPVDGSELIRARALAKRYGRKRVLANVDLDLAAGDLLLVTGPHGAGKTTLLRLLAGLAAPTGGDLTHAIEREEVGFLGHDPLVYRELSALENL